MESVWGWCHLVTFRRRCRLHLPPVRGSSAAAVDAKSALAWSSRRDCSTLDSRCIHQHHPIRYTVLRRDTNRWESDSQTHTSLCRWGHVLSPTVTGFAYRPEHHFWGSQPIQEWVPVFSNWSDAMCCELSSTNRKRCKLSIPWATVARAACGSFRSYFIPPFGVSMLRLD